jgi:hypothetical protein
LKIEDFRIKILKFILHKLLVKIHHLFDPKKLSQLKLISFSSTPDRYYRRRLLGQIIIGYSNIKKKKKTILYLPPQIHNFDLKYFTNIQIKIIKIIAFSLLDYLNCLITFIVFLRKKCTIKIKDKKYNFY